MGNEKTIQTKQKTYVVWWTERHSTRVHADSSSEAGELALNDTDSHLGRDTHQSSELQSVKLAG